MNKKHDDITDLLKELQDSGAEVHIGDKKGVEITNKTLEDIEKGITQNFDAWVSWTKSF